MNTSPRRPHDVEINGRVVARHDLINDKLGTQPGNGPGAAWPPDGRTDPRVREPIAAANLSKIPWPKYDPETIVQPQRVRNAPDRKWVMDAAVEHLDAEAPRIFRQTQGRPVAERVQHFLTNNVLNFNPVPPLRASAH